MYQWNNPSSMKYLNHSKILVLLLHSYLSSPIQRQPIFWFVLAYINVTVFEINIMYSAHPLFKLTLLRFTQVVTSICKFSCKVVYCYLKTPHLVCLLSSWWAFVLFPVVICYELTCWTLLWVFLWICFFYFDKYIKVG